MLSQKEVAWSRTLIGGQKVETSGFPQGSLYYQPKQYTIIRENPSESPYIGNLMTPVILHGFKKVCGRTEVKTTLPETNTKWKRLKMDGWNMYSFPFGAFRPIFRGELLVLGSVQ